MHRSLAVNAIRSSVKSTRPAVASASAIGVKRSLVSSVLLSRDIYDKKNVQELKSELKQRGLTTSGKRKDLIERLLSNDGSRARVFPTAETSDASQSRSASTKAAPTSKDSVKPETSHGSVGGSGKATVSHPPHFEQGQVSSNAHDETTGEIIKNPILEAPATAPGVPPEKAPRVPITFDVKIPYEVIGEERGPVIPLMTGYFHPETPLFSGFNNPDDGPVRHLPKVMTISGENTYHGGGPSHHSADFDGPDISRGGELSSAKSILPDELSISSAINSMFKTMRDDLGFNVDEAAEKKAKEAANNTVGSTRTLLREARDTLAARVGSLTSASGSGSASYSTSSYSGGSARPLNDEETRGLYVLAGILVGGFFLGGAAKPTKRQIEKVKAEVQTKAKEGKEEAPNVISDSELEALVKKAQKAIL